MIIVLTQWLSNLIVRICLRHAANHGPNDTITHIEIKEDEVGFLVPPQQLLVWSFCMSTDPTQVLLQNADGLEPSRRGGELLLAGLKT